jgi:5,10-methylenetetrahydromethanopterin reductase
MTDEPFGVGLFITGDVSAERTVELARLAEHAGFGSIWFADTLFYRGCIPKATATALATSRLRIGLGVLNPFNRHPTLIAMEVGALDEIAGGRVVLGLGASVEALLQQAGIEYSTPLSAVEDATHIVRRLLAGERCMYQGKHFSVRGAQLNYAPPRVDMPIYLGAVLPRAVALCGRIADGLVVSLLFSPEYSRQAYQSMGEAARRAGRDPALLDIVQYTLFSVLPDGDEARALARPFLASFLSAYSDAFVRQPEVMEAHAASSGLSHAEFSRVLHELAEGRDPQAAIPDTLLDAFTIAGSPEYCTEVLNKYREAGVKEVVALLPAGVDQDSMVRLIGEAVLPRLGAAPRGLQTGSAVAH